MTSWTHRDDIARLLDELRSHGYTLAALEQARDSLSLPEYIPPPKLALLIGREVEGIAPELIKRCDITLEIPQFGKKESLNVVQATAIAIYHCKTAISVKPGA